MSKNISRHSYTTYTGKPYIHYQGVPINAQTCAYIQSNQPLQNNRTIIRANQPNFAISGNSNAWANGVRKDNLYQRYAANSCK